MKYKLIKEYPGSPNLGTIVEKEQSSKSYFYRSGNKNLCVLNNHVEDNSEYWEKVNDNLWWVVFTKKDTLFNPYELYLIETYVYVANDSREYFKTKEEAENFILYNKPCLSYNDVLLRLRSNKNLDLDCLEELVKSLI
jgi:hypothetical protein